MEPITLTCRGQNWELLLEPLPRASRFRVHLPPPVHRDAGLFFELAAALEDNLTRWEKRPIRLLDGHIGFPVCWLILG